MMKFKPAPSTEKLKKMLNRQRLQSVFTFALGGLLLFQMVQFYQFRERLKFIDDLYDRDTAVMSDLDKGKDFLASFGSDLNEIRQFLLLPTKDYDFSGLDVDLASEEVPDLNTQIFDFVSSLGKYEKNEALYEANVTAVKETLTDPVWQTAGLVLQNPEEQAFDDRISFVFVDPNLNEKVLSVDLGYDGLFSVPLYYHDLELTDRAEWSSVFDDIQEFLIEDLELMRDSIQAGRMARDRLKILLDSPELEMVLNEKELALSAEQENDEQFFYQLRNAQLSAVGQFTVFKKDARMELSIDASLHGPFDPVDLNGMAFDAVAKLLSEEVDARTDLQKALEAKKEELSAILSDPAFVATLAKQGLHVGTVVETEARLEYPLLNAAGETLRILFLDKASLEVKVSSPSGQDVQTLSMATEELAAPSKKKAWICLSLSPVTLG